MVKYLTQPKTDGTRKCEELTLLCRKKLPEWDDAEASDQWFRDNVKYVIRENFDDLSDL